MVIKWLKYDWDNRRTHAPSLLRQLRLGLVPKKRLTKLMNSAILAIPECKKLYQEVMKALKSKKSQLQHRLETPHFFAVRSTITVSNLKRLEE